MEKNLPINKSKYNLYSYVLVIFTLFLVIFFTKDALFELKVNKSLKEDLIKKETSLNKELEDVKVLKENIESGVINKEELDKYLVEFSEEKFLRYFYDYSYSNDALNILEISFSQPELTDFGFTQNTVNLNLEVLNQDELLKFIDFLNDSKEYNLFVHELNFPMNEDKDMFSLRLPVKVLYK